MTAVTAASTIDDLRRFGVKLFIQPGTEPDPSVCIPVFHRWIRDKALGGLLIDVADYAHLSQGPRVLLVGHEGNLSLDHEDGRVAVLYTGKRGLGPTFSERLTRVTRTVLQAASLLENEAAFAAAPRVETNTLELVANDRLLVPADEDGQSTIGLLQHAAALQRRLYPDADASENAVTVLAEEKERLRLSLASTRSPSLADLLSRLS